jgi:hypothetical protein
MMSNEPALDIVWVGPFAWPRFESETKLPSIPKHPGVYLMAVEYKNGYLIYGAGITRRPIPTRFREHTLKYMSGDYNVLNITAMRRGIRKEIWHGWGWTPEKRKEYERRRLMIGDAARKQLAGLRIFVAKVGKQSRILERLEASIMNRLYQEPPPFCNIPDKGMMLAPRWESERVIVVKNDCAAILYGIPQCLEI